MTPETMAKAFNAACDLHEACWSSDEKRYLSPWYACCVTALNELGEDIRYAQPMSLAMDAWGNDVIAWCEDILDC